MFRTVVDKKTLNKLGAGVASLFATLIPVVLALQPDMTTPTESEGCGSATQDQELSEVRLLVAVLESHMPNVSSSCLQNRTLASLFLQAQG